MRCQCMCPAMNCDVITPEVFLDRSLKNEVSGPVIVNGCVRDPKIWMGMENSQCGSWFCITSMPTLEWCR